MKKWLSLMLGLCIACSFAACGNRPEDSSAPSTEKMADTSAAEHTLTSTTAPTEPSVEHDTLGGFQKNATIAETVLVDENDVKVTATGLKYGNYSVEVELMFENNSQKDLSFTCESLAYSRNSVNGYMIEDGFLSCKVAAGKKANDTIDFDYNTLMLFGIQELADIELGFLISDDDFNYTYTGPRQIKTSAYDTHDYSINYYQDTIASAASMNTFGYKVDYFTKDVIDGGSGINVLSGGVMVSQDNEEIVLLELENTTQQTVYAEISDIAINGLMVYGSAYSSDSITPGKHGILNMRLASVFDSQFWGAYGITEVDSVGFSVLLKDEEDHILGEPIAIKMDLSDKESAIDTSGNEVYNKDGLRIISKGIVEDPSEYSDDLHVLLLAENNGGATLKIDEVYDSLSVNGFMMDCYFTSKELKGGQCSAIEITLDESSLEKNKIASASDITELEIGLTIKQGSDVIDEPALKIVY